MSQYGEGAQVQVVTGRLPYDTTINKSSIEEAVDGTLKFVIKVTVDGATQTFESSQPDEFEGIELITHS